MSDDNANQQPSNDTEALPQWARDALSGANNDAADKRVKLKQKTQEHTEALNQISKLTDEKAEAEKAGNTAAFELKKLQTVLEAGVPGGHALSIASRLQGDTDDELKADATKLVEQFGLNQPNAQRATDPSQGRGGEPREKPSTPEGAFAQHFSELLRGR